MARSRYCSLVVQRHLPIGTGRLSQFAVLETRWWILHRRADSDRGLPSGITGVHRSSGRDLPTRSAARSLDQRQTESRRKRDVSPPESCSLPEAVSPRHASASPYTLSHLTLHNEARSFPREIHAGRPRQAPKRRQRPPRQAAPSHNPGSCRSFMRGKTAQAEARTQRAGRHGGHLRFHLGSVAAHCLAEIPNTSEFSLYFAGAPCREGAISSHVGGGRPNPGNGEGGMGKTKWKVPPMRSCPLALPCCFDKASFSCREDAYGEAAAAPLPLPIDREVMQSEYRIPGSHHPHSFQSIT
ncbi:hypothetical protein VUR80DRAFT_171 [Thermomyces stellatus]